MQPNNLLAGDPLVSLELTNGTSWRTYVHAAVERIDQEYTSGFI